jgi:hypothetical protein
LINTSALNRDCILFDCDLWRRYKYSSSSSSSCKDLIDNAIVKGKFLGLNDINCRYILIPWSINGKNESTGLNITDHAILILYSPRTNRIKILDSLKQTDKSSYSHIVLWIMNALGLRFNGSFETDDEVQQVYGYECGVITCMLAYGYTMNGHGTDKSGSGIPTFIYDSTKRKCLSYPSYIYYRNCIKKSLLEKRLCRIHIAKEKNNKHVKPPPLKRGQPIHAKDIK